jgi:beta-phosphoglucomutase
MALNVQKVKWGAARESVVVGDRAFADWLLSPAARLPARSKRPGLQAVLFDLDGVLVDTAEFHYRAWQQLADELSLPFDRHVNRNFRGVARMACLDLLLGEHARFFALQEKVILADRKNGYYLEQVMKLGPGDVADGVRPLVHDLRDRGIRAGVVSASRNARLVLSLLALEDSFDVVVDGNDVTRGKPDPQGFQKAAALLRVDAERCVVVEDAEAGLRAAQAAGMRAVGVGKFGGMPGLAGCVNEAGRLTVEMLEAAVP